MIALRLVCGGTFVGVFLLQALALCGIFLAPISFVYFPSSILPASQESLLRTDRIALDAATSFWKASVREPALDASVSTTTTAALTVSKQAISSTVPGIPTSRAPAALISQEFSVGSETGQDDPQIVTEGAPTASSSKGPDGVVGNTELDLTFDTVTDWSECSENAACCQRLLVAEGDTHLVRLARVKGRESAKGLSFPMALHSHNGDIVSSTIAASGSWDTEKTEQILEKLRGEHGQIPGTLVDVGANVGWFTMAAAMAGFPVVAIEPFEENQRMLKHSLCLAQPAVRKRVTLLQAGLHDRDNVVCQLWQQPFGNRGDTISICDKNLSSNSVSKLKTDGYRKLGEASMQRLDSFLAEGTVKLDGRVVMKIDVEGFESFALHGAKEFLNGTTRPEMIISEFSPFMMELASQGVGEDGGTAATKAENFLEFMRSVGYVGTPVVEGVEIQDIVFTPVTEPV